MEVGDAGARVPESVVAAEVGGRSPSGQAGIGVVHRPHGRERARAGEHRTDPRRRPRQDVDAAAEDRALAIVRADDERHAVRATRRGMPASGSGARSPRRRRARGRTHRGRHPGCALQRHGCRDEVVHRSVATTAAAGFGGCRLRRRLRRPRVPRVPRARRRASQNADVLLGPSRGHPGRVDRVRRRALRDRPREEPARRRRRHECGHGVAAGRLAEHRHVLGIPAETADVVPHPPQQRRPDRAARDCSRRIAPGSSTG